MKYYFAIKDGCTDPETGEKDEAGMVIRTCEAMSDEEAMALVEAMAHFYKGRLRRITREEYERNFGEDK